MGRLIVSANMTTDMVIDPLEGWFQPDLAMADGLAQLSAADAIILGRKTFESSPTSGRNRTTNGRN